MSFDALVANPGRLTILTALAVEERQEFVRLKRHTRLTDGNLAAHAKRLQSGGLINIDKQFREGRPVTSFALTGTGRLALESHVRRVMSALSHRRLAPLAEGAPMPEAQTRDTSSERGGSAVIEAPELVEVGAEDDWVD